MSLFNKKEENLSNRDGLSGFLPENPERFKKMFSYHGVDYYTDAENPDDEKNTAVVTESDIVIIGHKSNDMLVEALKEYLKTRDKCWMAEEFKDTISLFRESLV